MPFVVPRKKTCQLVESGVTCFRVRRRLLNSTRHRFSSIAVAVLESSIVHITSRQWRQVAVLWPELGHPFRVVIVESKEKRKHHNAVSRAVAHEPIHHPMGNPRRPIPTWRKKLPKVAVLPRSTKRGRSVAGRNCRLPRAQDRSGRHVRYLQGEFPGEGRHRNRSHHRQSLV